MALLQKILLGLSGLNNGAIGAKLRSAGLTYSRDQLIMRRPRSPTYTTIVTQNGESIIFDAAQSTAHDFSSKVTSYPVEDKTTRSDHVVNENPTFSVTGVFSDASIGVGVDPTRYTQAEVYQKLQIIREKRETVSLITPLSTFTDLIVTRLSLPKATGQGSALFVTITFENIRVVSNVITTTTSSKSSIKKKSDKAATQKQKETDCKLATEKKTGTKEAESITDLAKSVNFREALSTLEKLTGGL